MQAKVVLLSRKVLGQRQKAIANLPERLTACSMKVTGKLVEDDRLGLLCDNFSLSLPTFRDRTIGITVIG
ncbi:hypothetical protein QQG55_47515 [Brugia pahangi]